MLMPHHRKQILAMADCNPRTLARVYAGLPVHHGSYERIRKAAEAIGAEAPPSWVRAIVGIEAKRKAVAHAS